MKWVSRQLLGLGGILAYFLSPIAKTSPSLTIPIPTFSPILSLDVGSFILIGDRDSLADTLNEPIELLTNTRDNTVKGRVANGSILKVTRKFYKSEETWLELEVCSTKKRLTTDRELIYYLQPKDVGWIQEVTIENSLDIINLLEENIEQVDGCAID